MTFVSEKNDNVSVYGALDLGTNNCRLLIARPRDRGFVITDSFSRVIRLGEGIGENGNLSDAAMDRAIKALKVCASKMVRHNVRRSRLVVTEAARKAGNASEFIEEVRLQTGLRLEIIDGETEARFAVSGCSPLLDTSCDNALVFDIGGGSSEFIWLDLGRYEQSMADVKSTRAAAEKCITGWASLPMGVVTMAEEFGGHCVTADIFRKMVEHSTKMLGGFEARHNIRQQVAMGNTHLLGTSGTVTTVAAIHLGLTSYDRNKVDGCWMSSADAQRVSDKLVGMRHAERITEPCIGTERADLVLAGCAILEAVMRMWPCDRLRVADRGLREGILASLMSEDGYLAG